MNNLHNFTNFIEFLNRKWAIEILQVLNTERRRFVDIKSEIDGISNKMLSERLKDLYKRKYISKIVISLVPLNIKYALSELGEYLLEYCYKIDRELEDLLISE